VSANWTGFGPLAGALVDGDSARLLAANRRIAELPGPIVLTQGVPMGGEGVEIAWLMNERSVSTNTTAAGGNASLVAMS
jgi:RHH-type proline utilization regulon transcriptional repressor/proline dehydrogenase/delta 1-pyrroline-5-carboxylate dehydrogenase